MRRVYQGFGVIAICLGLGVTWSGQGFAQQNYGPVTVGQGVYAVASLHRKPQDGLNLKQWALAIFAANRDQFGNGLDQLESGSLLTIPSPEQARKLWRIGKKMSLNQAPRDAAAQVASIMQLDDGYRPVSELRLMSDEVASPLQDAAPLTTATPAPAVQAPVRDSAQALISRYSGKPVAPDHQQPAAQVAETWIHAGTPPAIVAPSVPGTSVLDPKPGRESTAAATPAVQPTATRGLQTLKALERTAPGAPFKQLPLYAEALAASASGDSASVLGQLRALEADYAGDSEFDYLYGVLLLDAGNPQEALYPLLRASNESPESLGIRIDLGRAYFDMGENESARLVFTTLAEQAPPPTAAVVIASYLEAIQDRAVRYERRTGGRLALNTGYDSNANSATALDNFAGFELDERARSTESRYSGLVGELNYSSPLTARWSWILAGTGRVRQFGDADYLDTIQFGLSSSQNYRQGNWGLSLQFNGGQTLIDGRYNSHFLAVGSTLNVQHSPMLSSRYGLRLQQVRYDATVAVRDIDQLLLSMAWAYRHNLGYGSEFSWNLLYGHDAPTQDDSPYGRNLFGLGISELVQITPSLQLAFNSNVLKAIYDGQFVDSDRDDLQIFNELSLSVLSQRWKHWGWRLAVAHVDNGSSIELYDYDRLDVSIGLMRVFR